MPFNPPGPASITSLHLTHYTHLVQPELLCRRATCIAYETIEKVDGSLPILAPMSEVAGRLSIQMGMR